MTFLPILAPRCSGSDNRRWPVRVARGSSLTRATRQKSSGASRNAGMLPAMTPLPLLDDAKSIAGWIIDLRRQLHRHPGLPGIPDRHSVAKTGVVATIGRGSGRCEHHPKFRGDEAALPIGAALHVAMAVEALAAGEPVRT